MNKRRRYPRCRWSADAVVTVGERPHQRSLRGKIQNVSATGACIEMEPGARDFSQEPVVVRWQVPAQFTPHGTPQKGATRGTLVRNGVPRTYGIRFDRPIEEQVGRRGARWKKMFAVGAGAVLAALIGLLKARNVVSFWYTPLIQVYSLLTAVYVLSRLALSMFYRQPPDRGALKTVSIVIAVKNEEAHIADTIERCFQSHYPEDLLEVLAIDDGSSDGTWAVLRDLQARYPTLQIFRFAENRGKRHAMALGAQRARGEILVYMDSDSLLDPEGLYRIVQPFEEEAVGAVAGHTLVLVDPGSFISKMEGVRYFVSQRVMKAAESLFGAVTCCPGPFSAYRREAVLAALPAWLHQTFLGTTATFGDDRSLTNFILRNYRVLYHAGARCRTYVPDRWGVFFRQQLRWKKSWVREATVASRILVRKHPVAALSYYLSVLITFVSPAIVLRAFLYSPLVLASPAYLPYSGGLALVFLLLGLVYYYHTQSRFWYYGVAFAALYACFFSLQTYYAVLTVRQNHWGTR